MLRSIHQNITRINQYFFHLIISNLHILQPAFGLLLTMMILQSLRKTIYEH